ncbi:MAG: LacI family DNA-binding transcriptional regulator [Spirochaetia bacterium]|nr:LacI family DNA-binding transcriptional regulator [Spirochaetia bacterium]
MKKTTKVDRFEKILETLADKKSPHDEFPNERWLAGEFQVSRETIRRVIERLIRKGRLYRRRSVGTFASPPKRVNTILCVSAGGPPTKHIATLFPIFLSVLLREINEADTSLLLAQCSLDQLQSDAGEIRVRYPELSAIVLFNVSAITSLLAKMVNSGIPVIYFGSDEISLPRGMSGILFREKELIGMSLEKLKSGSNREIAYWGPSDYPQVAVRKKRFLQMAGNAGITVIELNGSRKSHKRQSLMPLSPSHRLSRLLRQRKKPLAVFCSTDSAAVQLVNTALLLGKKVPEDVQVVGVEGSPLGELAVIPVSAVRIPLVHGAERCVAKILDLLGGGKPGIEYLPVEWVPRASTFPARPPGSRGPYSDS